MSILDRGGLAGRLTETVNRGFLAYYHKSDGAHTVFYFSDFPRKWRWARIRGAGELRFPVWHRTGGWIRRAVRAGSPSRWRAAFVIRHLKAAMDRTERDDWMYNEPAEEYILRTHLDVRIVRLDVRKPYAADWLVPFGDVEVDLGWYSPRFRAEDLTVEPLVMVGHDVEIPKPAGPRNDLTITSFQYYLALAVNTPGVLDAALEKAGIRVLPRNG